jgi:predicted nuclease with TOPRIM domain
MAESSATFSNPRPSSSPPAFSSMKDSTPTTFDLPITITTTAAAAATTTTSTTTVLSETLPNDQATELPTTTENDVDDEYVVSSTMHQLPSSSSSLTGGNNQHRNSSNNIINNNHGCVQVAVRVRPMLPHEAGTTECVDVLQTADTNNNNNNNTNAEICDVIRLGGVDGPKFTFDQVFGASTYQSQVYDDKVAPLVANCLEGYNATVLAYGQTGSGKTHTIMGPSTSITTAMLEPEGRQQAGVIPRAIRSIFYQLQRMKDQQLKHQHPSEDNATTLGQTNIIEDGGGGGGGVGATATTTSSTTSPPGTTTYEYEVRVQFLEVYGEEIRDLLNPQQQATSTNGVSKLSIRDVGDEEPEVVGATQHRVDSAEEALLCLTRGMYRRVTGSTAMNESSSRSHAILSLVIEQSTVLDSTTTSEVDSPDFSQTSDENGLQSPRPQQQQQPPLPQPQQQQHVQLKRSRFNFVDLAGSERQKRTQATGQRLKEGIDINKGLLVLGNVISALGDPKKQGKTFVPYRDSKLTRLLKGSLGGNHKTLMIACVSPSSSNMEETLNCLRYANRAKNIQNHAVVNVDATSQLVAELKGKVQRLAVDLMRARTGKISECSIPMDVIESLAIGGDGGDVGEDLAMTTTATLTHSPYPSRASILFMAKATPEIASSSSSSSLTENIKLKAENEAYRLQCQALSNGHDPSDALQKAYVTKATEYERVIAHLKSQIVLNSSGKVTSPRSGRSRSLHDADQQSSRYRSESPELSRLKAQIFGSLSQSSQLDAEVEAEEVAVKKLATKYLNHPSAADVDEFVEDEIEAIDHEHDDGTFKSDDFDTAKVELPEDLSIRLEADLFTLSTSINAKEELIHQLQAAQEKYESMREFYEEKLKEMSSVLIEKEAETEKLIEELKKLDVGNSRSTELSERLKQKQEQVAELRRKQAELVRLTTVSSRNESQISKLRNEVFDMKQKKIDMQKQITAERKNHALEVQKLKKESMQKDRELNKVKRGLDQKTIEASKAQQVAKSRLDQMVQLKAKYKDTEKRLRMQTVKRGVMKKAGLDPVIVGRRQSRDTSKEDNKPSKGDSTDDGINFDSLRDFFDQKVADVGRRENLAEKLAQEWEEHLELTVQRDDLHESDDADRDTALKSMESQIKYREERIRQLASRLGKREQTRGTQESDGDDTFLFDEKFVQVVGKLSKTASATIAAKVLFGMVVRERRRIASLARTASALDEKVQEAEVAAEAKDAAFRAFVDEHRLESAALAQSQQEHILSLMEMVKEPTDENHFFADESGAAFKQRVVNSSAGGKSKLLVLCNERISVLERQLNEAQLGRDAVREHREREEEALALLEEKNQECEDLEGEIDDLRTALRRIREEVARSNGELTSKGDFGKNTPIKAVEEIVFGALHSSTASTCSRRRRSTSSSKILGHSPSLTPRIKRDTQFMHSSDSDEIPDWAEDIMADLAVIAEGKIPQALLESQEVLVAESQLNHNVFDRLTDPESFTGVQKQRNSHSNRLGKARPISGSNAVGQEQRKMISMQVADSLNKVVIPAEKKKKKSSAPRKAKENLSFDAERRSVFDRLISPSNLTGTQKRKFHDNKGRTLEKAIETQHVSVSRGRSRIAEYEADRSEGEEADFLLDNILLEENDHRFELSSEIRSPSTKLDEYKRLDVFERLNKTTTQAYAVKQNTNIAEKMLCDILDSSDQENDNELHQKSEPRFERVAEYASQDVFERLQRTTTEAYAKKAHSPLDDAVRPGAGTQSQMDSATPSRLRGERNAGSPPKNPQPSTESPKYLDVFDRLQRKTTEAYAQKMHPPA